MGTKLGSLFSGIGGFEIIAQMYGIEPVWASEIDKNCVNITKRHFPHMQHLGDITQIDGSNIEPVDVITFGSPCQDLSVAGSQKGLSGERSGLFMEAIRIIKEMRISTDGRYPTFAVWENVRGAFSSNRGEDFRIVVEKFCRIKDETVSIPRPTKEKWTASGLIMGDSFSFAWRVLDAQYWGAPQRRRRIFSVADFRGSRSAEILFKPESLRRNLTPSRAPWKRFAGTSEDGAGSTGNKCKNPDDTQSGILCVATQQANAEIFTDLCPTITEAAGTSGNNQPYICVFHGNAGERAGISYVASTQDCRNYKEIENVSGTLQTKDKPGYSLNYQNPVRVDSAVRRLTPVECERLQGYPDGWTEYGADGKQISDSARYRALGNSVALPCVDYVISGIKDALDNSEKEQNDRHYF